MISENTIKTYTLPVNVKQPAGVWCMMQGTQSQGSVIAWSGGGEGCSRGFRRQRTDVYLWPIHADVWQRLPQYCKVIIL